MVDCFHCVPELVTRSSFIAMASMREISSSVVLSNSRVFSLLNSSFCILQQNFLEDYIETVIMLQYNTH